MSTDSEIKEWEKKYAEKLDKLRELEKQYQEAKFERDFWARKNMEDRYSL